MPKTFTESVFSSTYKDDFIDSDNYHRILFNSGRALQARELTQLQTIIQEEIARFGRNIFKEGASVNPGGPTITSDYEFVKIASTNIPTDTSTLIGTTITQSGGTNDTVQAKILQFVGAEGSDPDTLYVQYINTSGAGQSNANPVRFNAGATLTGPASGNLTVQSVDTTANPATGRGCLIANGAGDFFARGHFVFAKAQKILLSKYTRFPTKVVGFKITEDIVTSADDTALFDNQGAVPNLSSPGADRYRIQLTLTTKDQIASDENFVYYCDVVDGNIVDQVTGADQYNKINELLAQRTFDESGNYIVKNFDADYTDSGTNLIASIGDGVAYINGYRGATEKPTKLTIPKPRTTITNTNENVGINYGQYINVEGGADISGDLSDATFEQLVLVDSAGANAKLGGSGNGGKIGTARLRYLEEDGADHKAYLFDIQMDAGKSFRNTKMIARVGETNQFAKVVLENSKCVLKESQKVNLLYPTPNPRPKSVTDVDFEVQRVFTDLSPTGGNLTSSLSVSGEAFASKDSWVVIRGDGTNGQTVVSPTITITGNTSFTISGGTPAISGSTGTYTVYAKVQKSQPTLITKTLTTVEAGITSSGSEINLHRADLFDVEYIRADSANGTDVSNLFTIDNGQRAGFYDNARLKLNAGSTMPSTTFYKFRHFTHGNGDYMSVNSYTGQVDYEDIPNFSSPRKQTINLRDVIDFRPIVDSDGNFSGARAIAIEPPTSSDLFQADIEYYQPRADKIVVTTDGVIKHIQGQDGFGSQVPDTPENTLGLYDLELNAYGLHDSDLVSTPIRAKRFRMQDIEKIENRIDKLEEVTSLSLLENSTDSLLVLDGSGNVRTKSGFFVDNFVDRNFSDTTNSEYRAGIDPSRGILQPATFEDNVGLVYDSDKSSNTILKGDTIYLKHTEVQAIAQELVSGTENVNPFAVITGEGNITLSPATDEWTQTKYAPANVINKTAEETLPDLNEGNLALGTARNRGFGQWAWSGFSFVPLIGFGFIPGLNIFGGWANWITWNNNGVSQTRTQRVGRNIVRSYEQRVVVGSRTVRKVVGDRSVSLTFLPFIRSRKLFFKAEGLRPNTRYFPFFDGKAVDNFVREETFKRHTDAQKQANQLKYGNKYRNSTEHPQTKSNLISDGNGEIAGSFFIPSSTTNRFRAGTREFKLLDVSVDNGSELSSASANYVAQGTLDTRQETITSTRITQVRTRRWTETQRVRRRDPLAQSFAVTTPSGMFVTSVECFFASKDADVPVELQIRPMVNGSPSATDIIGNAIKFLSPGSVNTTAVSGATQATVVANPTKFTFDEPIFLNPDTEYAIVLLAESIEYNAYVAETYAFELGSTEKRISRQPSMGSLFKSQNGTTWEPDQTKDLMFRIYRADFDTNGGYAVFENASVEEDALENNGLYLDHSNNKMTVLMPNHGYDVGDTVNIEQLDSENYPTFGLAGNTLTGSAKTITAVDGFGFQFTQSGGTSSGRFGGTNIAVDRQIQFDTAIPQFTTMIPEDTTLNYNAKFTTGTSLAKVTGNQVRYQKDANYSADIVINDENRFDAPRLIAKDSNETANLGAGVRSTTFKVDMTSARSSVSPVIDAQRASLSTQGNQIDKQANSAGSGLNVPLNYQAETSAFGGSTLAKHMTTVQTLEETAVGLKILVSCMRPSEANFRLFYRTAASDENLIDKDFVEQSPEQTIAPDAENFREYRFLAGGNGGTLDDFTQYQVKIVMESTNTSRIPIFKDLRVIAMAT